jgi:DNA invertase Pin-like site-specific DNA recombinase
MAGGGIPMAVNAICRTQRCAIYTRKSTEDQWDREFSSIESQRDICSAYITCQQHKQWESLPESYDDAGYSGANLYRPALQRLLRDVEHGEIDVVVIYKIDRLTRSLGDFIRLVQVLDHSHVKFVSVTQAFDTSDSMGRLVLNILLTFAQFERELIADRIRDKVASIKRRGMINGGRPPYGYDIIDHRLVVNRAEAEQVRAIFRRYLELGTCSALSRQLRAEGLRAKVFTNRAGVVLGGGPANNGMIYHILKNPVYVGRVPHNGNSYPGEHEAIVDAGIWEAAQALIAQRRKFGRDRQPRNFLKGLFRDSCGRRMISTLSGKKRLRYYQSARSAGDTTRRFRMRAEHLEELVLTVVKTTLEDRETTRLALRDIGLRGEKLDRLPDRGSAAGEKLEDGDFERVREILRSLVVEGEISQHRLLLVFRSTEVARLLGWDGVGLFEGEREAWTGNEPTFRVTRALDEVRFNRMVEMPVEPIAMEQRRTPRPELVRLIQTARAAQAAVDDERDIDIKLMAHRFRCSPQRFCRVLRLNYLAPDIVAAILAGAQPEELTGRSLLHGALPLDWDLQRSTFGFPPRGGDS